MIKETKPCNIPLEQFASGSIEHFQRLLQCENLPQRVRRMLEEEIQVIKNGFVELDLQSRDGSPFTNVLHVRTIDSDRREKAVRAGEILSVLVRFIAEQGTTKPMTDIYTHFGVEVRAEPDMQVYPRSRYFPVDRDGNSKWKKFEVSLPIREYPYIGEINLDVSHGSDITLRSNANIKVIPAPSSTLSSKLRRFF